jgi:hypothetical protein
MFVQKDLVECGRIRSLRVVSRRCSGSGSGAEPARCWPGAGQMLERPGKSCDQTSILTGESARPQVPNSVNECIGQPPSPCLLLQRPVTLQCSIAAPNSSLLSRVDQTIWPALAPPRFPRQAQTDMLGHVPDDMVRGGFIESRRTRLRPKQHRKNQMVRSINHKLIAEYREQCSIS